MYHYAANNPVRYTDPDGRFDQDHKNKVYTFDIKNKSDFHAVSCIMMDMQNYGYKARGVDKRTGQTMEFSSYSEMLLFSMKNATTDVFSCYHSPISNEPIRRKNPYQNKTEKNIYVESTLVYGTNGMSIDGGLGLITASSELNETFPVYIKVQFDFLTANFGLGLSDKKLGGSIGGNLVSASGMLEYGYFKIGFSLGLNCGGEISFDFDNHTLKIDGAFIGGIRLEIKLWWLE